MLFLTRNSLSREGVVRFQKVKLNINNSVVYRISGTQPRCSKQLVLKRHYLQVSSTRFNADQKEVITPADHESTHHKQRVINSVNRASSKAHKRLLTRLGNTLQGSRQDSTSKSVKLYMFIGKFIHRNTRYYRLQSNSEVIVYGAL